MALLKFKTSDGWKVLYGALLKSALRRERNLSDLSDAGEARNNLGLTGDVTTHYHSQYIDINNDTVLDDTSSDNVASQLSKIFSKYVKKAGDTLTGALNFANNTWNKMGDDANIGDKNLAGHICIQGLNGETGIAMHKYGDETNRGTINYDGSKFKFDKPVNITGATNIAGNLSVTGSSTISGNETVNGTIKTVGGFIADQVSVPQLNNYHQKVNFIYGGNVAGTTDSLTPFFGTSGYDYGGIVFGSKINASASDASGMICQLISQTGNELLFRGIDGSSVSWSAWKKVATTDDVTKVRSDLTTAISKAATISAQSIGTNGYVRFSNGLVLQWGRKLFNTNTVNSFINFNQPFSEVYAVVANGQRSVSGSIGGTYTYHMLEGQLSKTGFSIKSNIESGSGSQYIHWIALGKYLDSSQIAATVTVTFSKQGDPGFSVTYQNNVSESMTVSNPSSVAIKKGSTIRITNNKNGYQLQVNQGSTYKTTLSYNGAWTSGALSANTSFTVINSRVWPEYEGSGGEGSGGEGSGGEA